MPIDEEAAFQLWLGEEGGSRGTISEAEIQEVRNMFLETLRGILEDPSESLHLQTWLREKRNPTLGRANRTYHLSLGWGLMYNDPLGR